MLGRLNHLAIAVPDIEKAKKLYQETLGAQISEIEDQPNHGVRTVFIELPNTKIELITPLGENSPIKGFLDKNPDGGVHHLCFEVEDVEASVEKLKSKGIRILGTVREGAQGKSVIFLHPKDFLGTLIELEGK